MRRGQRPPNIQVPAFPHETITEANKRKAAQRKAKEAEELKKKNDKERDERARERRARAGYMTPDGRPAPPPPEEKKTPITERTWADFLNKTPRAQPGFSFGHTPRKSNESIVRDDVGEDSPQLPPSPQDSPFASPIRREEKDGLPGMKEPDTNFLSDRSDLFSSTFLRSLDEFSSTPSRLDLSSSSTTQTPPPPRTRFSSRTTLIPPGDEIENGGNEDATQNGENLEEKKHNQPIMTIQEGEDMIARGTARALAGVPQPPPPPPPNPPTEQAVHGYLGGRNVENSDIRNSSAAGTNTATDTRSRGPDSIAEAKAARNTATDTLRPTFGVAPPNGVIPTKNQQVQSDLLFSEFSVVAPGHGLGVTNKMFLMEEYRDKNFVYREPLAEPRKYDGPTLTVEPPPLQWQNQITRSDRHSLAAREIAAEASGVLLERRVGDGSLNVLGDDFGMFQKTSDKGLKRRAESPFEPQIKTPKAWERVKGLPGVQWSKKQFRRLFDAQRYPERFTPNVAMEGGPIMKRESALAIYPFPITNMTENITGPGSEANQGIYLKEIPLLDAATDIGRASKRYRVAYAQEIKADTLTLTTPSSAPFLLKSGGTVSGDLAITGGLAVTGSTPFLPKSGGTVSGDLAVTGGLAVTGAVGTGDLNVGGNCGVGGNLVVANTLVAQSNVVVQNTAPSDSTTTGALTVAGGVGIADNIRVGGSAEVGGTFTALGNTVMYGDAAVAGQLNVTGAIVTDASCSVGGQQVVAGLASFYGGLVCSSSGHFDTEIASNFNTSLGSNTGSYSDGERVIFIEECDVAPSNLPFPTGGILFVQGGALKWRSHAGTLTTMGAA